MASKVSLNILNTAAFILFVVGVSGFCPKDWIEHGMSCYMTDSVTRNWDDGAAYCDLLRGELLVTETLEENEFIQGILKNQNKKFTWLGCSDRSSEGQWLCYKDSASSLPFENWSNNEPNNRGGDDDCMTIYMENGKWSDSKCYADAVYTVCETTIIKRKGEGVIIPSSSASPISCYTFGSDGRLRM